MDKTDIFVGLCEYWGEQHKVYNSLQIRYHIYLGSRSILAWRPQDFVRQGNTDTSIWKQIDFFKKWYRYQCVNSLFYQNDILISTSQFVQGISRYNVTADQLHRRIIFRALLPQNRTREYRVITTLFSQVYFDLLEELKIPMKPKYHFFIYIYKKKKKLSLVNAYREFVLPVPDPRHLSLLHNLFYVEESRQRGTPRIYAETNQSDISVNPVSVFISSIWL